VRRLRNEVQVCSICPPFSRERSQARNDRARCGQELHVASV